MSVEHLEREVRLVMGTFYLLLCQEAERTGREMEIRRGIEIGIEMRMREHGSGEGRMRTQNNDRCRQTQRQETN